MAKRRKRPKTDAEKATDARRRKRGYEIKWHLYRFLRARGFGLGSEHAQRKFNTKYDVRRVW